MHAGICVLRRIRGGACFRYGEREEDRNIDERRKVSRNAEQFLGLRGFTVNFPPSKLGIHLPRHFPSIFPIIFKGKLTARRRNGEEPIREPITWVNHRRSRYLHDIIKYARDTLAGTILSLLSFFALLQLICNYNAYDFSPRTGFTIASRGTVSLINRRIVRVLVFT